VIQYIGSMGSHNSYGFGIIKIIGDLKKSEIKKACKFIYEYCRRFSSTRAIQEGIVDRNYVKLPNLRYAFKVDFKLNKTPVNRRNIGFILKYAIRNKIKREFSKKLAEYLFGSQKSKSKKYSGKIFISNCWSEGGSFFIRMYGILNPKIFSNSTERDDIIREISAYIKECLDAEVHSRIDFNSINEKNFLANVVDQVILND